MAQSILAAAVAAAILASPGQAAADLWSDPLEPMNRAVHGFNRAVLDGVLVPAAGLYRSTVPDVLRNGVSNAIANLREPVTAASSGLQGDFANAGVAVARFAINSTIGLAGVMDAAGAMGLVSRPEDMDQALCAHGVPEGPFLIIPFYGPSTLRDATAQAAMIAGGLSLAGEDLWAGVLAAGAVGALDAAPALAAFDHTSVDAYAAQRSAYLQHRRAACANGEIMETALFPEE
ncbi:VacJ family lipoprotein [Azospirillum sp. RWY-5-1]|uniref:VacJ family lipoprotein n=1 Tax=Azospirillum oleiclasticum TaxID=2735135 RepID=A0ABX2TAH3_9PROT|nr:VacJ family lipoprotein [Azospirillum oleiclasticum]NYZ15326.1 VacJ family lipoprotein [Azospirillum oleiclasticum]NYZ21253.1 VacJ family lipoprotein [Azospirillum oleiclasticum]